MKVDIIGRHPTIQPGFCGVMSLYEATHLGELGHDVRIVIPFRNAEEMRAMLKFGGVARIEDLMPEDANFDIQTVLLDGDVKLREVDVSIWQSTSTEDWSILYPLCKANGKVITKNFPKTVPGLPAPLPRSVVNQFSAFDLVAFALKEDFQSLWQYREFAQQNQHKFTYVYRGADPVILNNNQKSPSPVIAVDTPNTNDNIGIEHLLNPFERLKEKYKDLEIISLGGRDIPLNFSKRLSYMPYSEMYRKFLNPSWIYCVVDYSQSPAHIKGDIHNYDRSWDAKAIYEVQTVEAQMAGCIIAGYRKNVIPELVDPNSSLLWGDFATEDEITDHLDKAISQGREALSSKVRARAEFSFSWKGSVKNWEHAMLNLVENGYDRTRKVFPAISDYTGSQHLRHGPDAKAAAGVVAALKLDEKLLLHELANVSRQVVEFGCGGSTKIMLRSRLDKLVSFETSVEWIENVLSDPELAPEAASGRFEAHHIDIGPTHQWGYPVDLDAAKCARYAKSPWSKVSLDTVDLVLVDGRFRVAAALEAALRTEHHCVIAVDDYLDRPHYNVLEEHLDIAIQASRLVVFRKGEKWNRHKAFKTADEYRMDPR